MEVHSFLGPGFLESIYKHALIHELTLRGIAVKTEIDIPVSYKNHLVGNHRLDILVENEVILELKAVSTFNDAHLAQILSYLKATNVELALIFNFGGASLVWKRLIKSRGFRG